MLYIGFLGPVAAHTHAAPALLAGLHGALQVWQAQPGPAAPPLATAPTPWRVAWVPPGWAHALDGGGQPVAVLYLEPGHPAAVQGLATHRRDQATALAPPQQARLLDDLGRVWSAQHRLDLRRAGQQLLAHLGADLGPAATPQPGAQRTPGTRRPLAAQDTARWLRQDIAAQTLRPMADVAPTAFSPAAACQAALSETRLRHLFTPQLGTTMQRYRRWCRLVQASRAALHGGRLTDAAQTAGFADQAHFARAFRQMFGLPPSAVLGRPGTRWADLDEA